MCCGKLSVLPLPIFGPEDCPPVVRSEVAESEVSWVVKFVPPVPGFETVVPANPPLEFTLLILCSCGFGLKLVLIPVVVPIPPWLVPTLSTMCEWEGSWEPTRVLLLAV